jgi:glucokinase
VDVPDAVIAVDVGGTDIKAALCTADGAALHQLRRPTPVSDGVPAVVSAIAELITELADQPDHAIRGVGLILPGVVDAAAGIARYSTNIGWRDLPIREQVEERVGLPVSIEHDVRAAGLAEATLGAARGVDHALFLAIGTGIAGACIVGGELVTGATNQAGEIGHLPVMPDGDRCACGQQGCTETYASAAALGRRYLAIAGRSGPPMGSEQVFTLAADGDPVAVRVLDEAFTALGRALVSYTMLLDPSLIVIGGGLSLAGDHLLHPLHERIQAGLRWRAAPPLVVAHFGAESGRVGAALVGWRAYQQARATGG